MLPEDFRYAARALRKSPLFTIAAIVAIALGIGATTAIFSVTNAVLLRSLPYQDPDRLVYAISDMKKRNVKDFPFANADFIDLRNGTKQAFTEMAAIQVTGRSVVPLADGTPEQIRTASVTPEFFRMMGAKIAFGRDFEAADGEVPPPSDNSNPQAAARQRLPNIVILSNAYWKRRFGGNSSILGQNMPGSQPGASQIVGVLEPGFELLFPASANMEQHPDVWFAARIPYDAAQRAQVAWRVIARLKDGVSVAKAQSAIDPIAEQIRKTTPIKETAGFHVRLEPMHQQIVEQVKPALLALMGAAIFLLLIACANVANLLLVRASLRERELAVRTALGGTRARLVGQMFIEALLLALAGGALGLAVAYAGIRELLTIVPANLPRLDGIQIDFQIVAFTITATFAASILFGIVPALRASRSDVARLLRASGRTGDLANTGALRNVVVVAEVALAYVLLIGSGLMFRSFVELLRVDPGYDPSGVLTFQVQGRQNREAAQRAAIQQQALARLRAIPGVQSVSASWRIPLDGAFSPIRWGTEEALTDPSKFQAADWQAVLPGYFETMRTPIVAGRAFTDADNLSDRKLVIIDTLLAAKAFRGESAVGKRILIRVRSPEPEWVEVIGVAAHQRVTSLSELGREQIFVTDGFGGHGLAASWMLRTAGDPSSYSAAARSEITKLNPQLVVAEIHTAAELTEKARSATRFSLLLLSIFSTFAVLLAGLGLFGVLSTVVRQRTAEIGIRMALGADSSNVFKLVVTQGLRLTVAGMLLGLIAAFLLTRALTAMLVGVQPTDPATFVTTAAIFLAIAVFSAMWPARRAASLDPTTAMRGD